MNRHRLVTTGAALVAASVLLVGCGSGDEKGEDSGKKIAGADTGEKTSKSPSAPAEPSASAADEVDVKRPDITLPADLKMVTDWREPADAGQAQILADAVRFVQAMNYGITRQDAEDGGYKFYSQPLSDAQKFAQAHIKGHVDVKSSVSGVERLTRPKVVPAKSGNSAVAYFCVDDSKYYSKDVKTQKVKVSKPNGKAPTYFQLAMQQSTTTKGLWRANVLRVEEDSSQCG